MISGFSALAKRLKTLLDRASETRLARLDTPVSSRADASLWTPARAALLDRLDMPLSSLRRHTLKSQTFTASGTWTAPADLVGGIAWLSGCGGGGGGGYRSTVDAYCAGGDAGASCEWLPVIVAAGNGYAVAIGAGGVAPVFPASGDGGAGGNTVFGSLLALPGGAGGAWSTGTAPGGSGTPALGSPGDIVQLVPGGAGGGGTQAGGSHRYHAGGASGTGRSGGGGASRYGAGGAGAISQGATGGPLAATAATGYGAGGGGGGSGTSAAASDGAPGFLTIYWIGAEAAS